MNYGGKAWWSSRWLQPLGGRFSRSQIDFGRRAAAHGKARIGEFAVGVVSATVSDTGVAMDCMVRLRPFTDREWDGILASMSTDFYCISVLLSGAIPTELEDICRIYGRSLFADGDGTMDTQCACASVDGTCRHVPAVYFELANGFEEDPFRLLAIRGRKRQEIVDSVFMRLLGRVERAPQETAPAPLCADNGDRFFQAGANLGAVVAQLKELCARDDVFVRLGHPYFVEPNAVAAFHRLRMLHDEL